MINRLIPKGNTSERGIRQLLMSVTLFFSLCLSTIAQQNADNFLLVPFGDGGTKKMMYDRRQRPQALLMDDVIHLVYNGGASPGATKLEPTMPFYTTYNLRTSEFAEPVQLPGVASIDHHFGPIIWADNDDLIHVISGCHRTPGTHVIRNYHESSGNEDWIVSSQINPSMSYPSISHIY